MPTGAVIHSATRIVVCTTIDPGYVIPAGFQLQVVPDGWSPPFRWTVLNADGTARQATDTEVEASELDDVRISARVRQLAQDKITACQAIEASSTNAAAIAALKQLATAERLLLQLMLRRG